MGASESQLNPTLVGQLLRIPLIVPLSPPSLAKEWLTIFQPTGRPQPFSIAGRKKVAVPAMDLKDSESHQALPLAKPRTPEPIESLHCIFKVNQRETSGGGGAAPVVLPMVEIPLHRRQAATGGSWARDHCQWRRLGSPSGAARHGGHTAPLVGAPRETTRGGWAAPVPSPTGAARGHTLAAPLVGSHSGAD